MQISTIREESPEMEQCIEIWRENSETLGFLPRGAFVEYARRGQILGALTPTGEVVGYLLYRLTQRGSMIPLAVIVHLCVENRYRGEGIAESLVNSLAQALRDKCMRIELKCRRDFKANDLWPNLGFHAIGETEGRVGKPLVKWSMPLIHPPLFKVGSPVEEEELYRVVIDANIFFRLEEPVPIDDEDAAHLSMEAKALEADWLPNSLGFYITDELNNEIQRNENPTRRKQMLEATRRYGKLTTDIHRMRRIESTLLGLFPENPTDQTRSDVRQLAHAIAAQAHFFITQDTELLKKPEIIHDTFPISVVSPGEFVSFLDETLRDIDFRPSLLAGVREIHDIRASVGDFSNLYPTFRCNEIGERKNAFNQELRRYFAEPTRYSFRLASHASSGHNLLFLVTEMGNHDLIRIPFIRISADPLARTVARHLLLSLILHGSRENIRATIIERLCPNSALQEAISETGFISRDGISVRISLNLMATLRELGEELLAMSEAYPILREIIEQVLLVGKEASKSSDLLRYVELERLLWPLKLKGIALPTYLIPIHPQWSMHLFDQELADQTLWGARQRIALSVENVYYRSGRQKGSVRAPGRILWYVTDSSGYTGVKQIRACSILDEVHIESASGVFKRFNRLGVYTWKDVLKTAGGDPNRDVMAIRFSYTEAFPNPILLDQYKSVLRAQEGKAPMLQSPSELAPETFEALYAIGTSGRGRID
jgi:ribosomal protein S18 acetylase RimI-like enzyme/predicted nucleic acid-binding protein